MINELLIVNLLFKLNDFFYCLFPICLILFVWLEYVFSKSKKCINKNLKQQQLIILIKYLKLIREYFALVIRDFEECLWTTKWKIIYFYKKLREEEIIVLIIYKLSDKYFFFEQVSSQTQIFKGGWTNFIYSIIITYISVL
jgi:hypothetical protein